MICAAFAVIAVGVTLYPLISNLVSETNRSIIETKYTKAVEKMDDTEKIRARTDAQNYNATLQAVTEKPYTKDALQKAAESYDHLLNIRGDGIMGYLEIPVLNLELPIYHGTEESTLDRGLGHLLGSSLPVGGQGTHTVITGHSGLAGKRMFSDLDQLKKGDVFYVKTLDETLAYMVLDINTVLPEDTSRLRGQYPPTAGSRGADRIHGRGCRCGRCNHRGTARLNLDAGIPARHRCRTDGDCRAYRCDRGGSHAQKRVSSRTVGL